MYPKDPDRIKELSDLGLHYLLKPICPQYFDFQHRRRKSGGGAGGGPNNPSTFSFNFYVK